MTAPNLGPKGYGFDDNQNNEGGTDPSELSSMMFYPHPSHMGPMTGHSESYHDPNDDYSPNTSDRFSVIHSTNLFKQAFGNQRQINPSLSRMSFCVEDNSLFAVGTEEQDPYKKAQNALIVASLDVDSKTSQKTVNVNFFQSVPEHVRDIQWFDSDHILFAMNQKMGILCVNLEKSSAKFSEIILFPEFHKDTIREVAVSEHNRNYVISGGFDGNVFVTDITRLVADIKKNEKKSENSLYPCREVVGSVSWHITDPYLASCTTDTGTLHIFDIRTDKRRPTVVHDTTKKELYCHSYRDSNSIMLGFGDGSMQLFDLRTKRCMTSVVDNHQSCIGDIRFDHKSQYFATFGSPSVSLFRNDDSFTPAGHIQTYPNVPPGYKTAGDMRRGANQVLMTDSLGNLTVCEYSKQESSGSGSAVKKPENGN